MLAAAAGLALALALAVRRPEPAPRREAHGPRLVRVSAARVRAVSVARGDDRITLRRRAAGWDVGGRPADAGMTDAANALVDLLVRLRALDAFPGTDPAAFGLATPRGAIVVETDGGDERLALGAPNAAGSAFYARRGDERRVLQVGMLLLSAVDRVFYERDRSGAPAQRPEIG